MKHWTVLIGFVFLNEEMGLTGAVWGICVTLMKAGQRGQRFDQVGGGRSRKQVHKGFAVKFTTLLSFCSEIETFN